MNTDELENKIEHLYKYLTQNEILFNGKIKSLEAIIRGECRRNVNLKDEVKTLNARVEYLEENIGIIKSCDSKDTPQAYKNVLIKINAPELSKGYLWTTGYYESPKWIIGTPRLLGRLETNLQSLSSAQILEWRELPTD